MTSLLCGRSEALVAGDTSLLSAQRASAAASGPGCAPSRIGQVFRAPWPGGKGSRSLLLSAQFSPRWEGNAVLAPGAPGVKDRALELPAPGRLPSGGRRSSPREAWCSLPVLVVVSGPPLGPSGTSAPHLPVPTWGAGLHPLGVRPTGVGLLSWSRRWPQSRAVGIPSPEPPGSWAQMQTPGLNRPSGQPVHVLDLSLGVTLNAVKRGWPSFCYFWALRV